MTEVNIGINSELGSGTNKIVYKVKSIRQGERGIPLFKTDLPLANLVIASMEPDRILDIQEGIKPGIKLSTIKKIEEKNEDYKKYIRDNKLIKEVINELLFHQQYAVNTPQMAPNLYKVTLKWFTNFIKDILIEDFLADPYKYLIDVIIVNNSSSFGILEIYVLEQRCGEGLTKNKNIEIDNNFDTLVNKLIDNMSEIGQTLFTDFKPQNSCPLYNPETGKLENIIALDLDAKFTYDYNDIQNDFKSVTGEEINIEDIKQMCKDIMYLEYMFNLLVWYNPDIPSNLTEEEFELEEKKEQKIKDTILEFIKNKLSYDKLLQIISFICYLTINELHIYNNNGHKLDSSNIGFKFPLIYYILQSWNYKIITVFNKKEEEKETKEDKIKKWFIEKPFYILSKTIYEIELDKPIKITILKPEAIFIEEPVDESNGLVPSLDSDSENEVEVEDERASEVYSPFEYEDPENDAKFAYGFNPEKEGGSIRRKNKSKKRKVTKRKVTKRKSNKKNKKRYTKRRNH